MQANVLLVLSKDYIIEKNFSHNWHCSCVFFFFFQIYWAQSLSRVSLRRLFIIFYRIVQSFASTQPLQPCFHHQFAVFLQHKSSFLSTKAHHLSSFSSEKGSNESFLRHCYFKTFIWCCRTYDNLSSCFREESNHNILRK